MYCDHWLPVVYFLWAVTNAFNSAYFPVSAFNAWDNTGAFYNASAIVSPDGIFDEQAYANYSPLFMSITLVMTYGAAFGAFTSVLVHTFCT